MWFLSIFFFLSHAQDPVWFRMEASQTRCLTEYDKTVDNGKFAFENPTAGEYLFCFQNLDRVERTIQFKVTVGVHAQDYSELATSNNLEPLERELQRLLDTVKDTMHNLELSRDIQSGIHKTNTSTHRRTLWCGVLTICVLIALNLWQNYYLKDFFKKVK